MNDDFDKKLYRIFDSYKKIPKDVSTEIEKIVYRCINKTKDESKLKQYSIPKLGLIACAMLIATTGFVYAGNTIYNKIWVQPEKTVGFYSEKNETIESNELSKAKNLMNENDAKKYAKEILNKFGYPEEKIVSAKLNGNANNYNYTWDIETSGKISLSFSANGKNYLFVDFEKTLPKNIEDYHTTEKLAEKNARELCKKYGYDLSRYNNVEISHNMLSQDESYIWYTEFNKKYNELVNPYESIRVGFIPEINKLYYFIVLDSEFEDNPVEITEEQAKQIAIQEERKVNKDGKIDVSQNKIGIKKMNGDSYLRLTNFEKYYEQKDTIGYPIEEYEEYRTEERVRKVWEVTVVSNLNESSNTEYTYYIDATTGEVIGGN